MAQLVFLEIKKRISVLPFFLGRNAVISSPAFGVFEGSGLFLAYQSLETGTKDQ